ncbi:MAG TPA: thioredoxin family protein [Chthoniobacteraceae bacterium]|nr:thioredoxin family protein [Chthoniobacteraceae bacterium]
MNTEATIFDNSQRDLRGHAIVSREEWLLRRKELLLKEKELTQARDRISADRRALPWVRVDKGYVFDAPEGKRTLRHLFEGRSQLVIYHFMFGPEWQEGCPSCSFVSDHIDGTLPHLAARDVTVAMVSRAPLEKIEAFKKRMGWRFKWVSSSASDFNHDFHVSFTKEERAKGKVEYNYTLQEFPSEEAPGVSVFYKDHSGELYHTYSTFGRGLDPLLGTYTILDFVPKGRDEDQLGFSMEWVRYHDRYGTDGFADTDKPYWPEVETVTAKASCGCGSEVR